jgi:hypothetical protein
VWLAATLAVSLGAAAWNTARAAPPAAAPPAAAPPSAAPPSADFVKAIASGKAKFAARDFPGAIDAFRKAATLRPHDALAGVLLGEAQVAAGLPADADATWTQAATDSEGDPPMHARTLFLRADLAERQKNWADAKARWAAYIEWATQHPGAAAFVATAEARTQAIDRAMAQDKIAEAVKKRIADTADGGVFSEVDASPSGK